MALGPRTTIAIIASMAAFASVDAARAQDEKTTSLTADFGFVSTAGNTSVSTFNLGDKFVAQKADKSLIFTQVLGIVYGRADGVKNAENYRAQARVDVELTPKLYLFGLTGWDRNVFGGIDRRFEETIGLALRALRLPNDELTLEAGLSLFQQRNTTADESGEFDDNFKAGRAGALYKHTFTKTTFLTQSIEFTPNFDNSEDWRLDSETALVAPISTHVGLKVGYVVRFDNLPGLAPDPSTPGERLKKTDRFLTAGLTISY